MDEEEDLYGDGEDFYGGGQAAVAAAPVAAPVAPVQAPANPNALPPQWWIRPPEAPRPDAGKISAVEEMFNTLPPEQAIKTLESAMQLEGMLGFEGDVKAGMATMDAIRKWAPKMYFKHPAAVAALHKPVPPPFTPGTIDVGGHKLIQTSPNRYQIAPGGHAPPPSEIKVIPLRTPEGKLFGYGIPGKDGAVHFSKELPNAPNIRPSDVLRSYPAELRAIEKQIQIAEDSGDSAAVKQLSKEYTKTLNDMRSFRRGGGASPVAPPPAALPASASGGGVRVRDKKSGKVFRYKGSVADIPQGQYEVLP